MAASMTPTMVISAPLAHHERVVTSDFAAPTAKCAAVLIMNDAITAGMPTAKTNGMIGTKPPTAVDTLADSGARPRHRGAPHHLAAAGIPGHSRHDPDHGPEGVVDAVRRVTAPTRPAHVPPLAAKNRVGRRARGRHRAAGKHAEHGGVVALLV